MAELNALMLISAHTDFSISVACELALRRFDHLRY